MFYRLVGIEVNRDNKRLEQVRSLPCCVCGIGPRSQAAHSNFGIHGKGKGIKADDKYTIPLCHSCHSKLDQYNMGMNREQSLEWFMKKWRETNRLLKWQERKIEQNGVDY